MEKRGNREQIVLATKVNAACYIQADCIIYDFIPKYTSNYMRGVSFNEVPQKSLFVGNSIKSLHNSLNASLKKLRTDYVDILYVHWWDYTCAVDIWNNR